MTSYGETRLAAAPRANFVEDMTQTAGLTTVYGLIALITNIISLTAEASMSKDMPDSYWEGDGPNGTFPPIARLLGFMTVTLFGLISVIIGFQYLACKWGSKISSLIGLGITLAAWFPFLVTISFHLYQADFENVGGGPVQIDPDAYGPTTEQIWAVTIMGILGFYGYAGTVIGALTFLHWKMYRYFAGYAHTYTASYYRSRLFYYGFLAIMTGLVQLSFGAYIIDNFGDGELPAHIAAGPFFVLFPELSVTVGLCQFLLGIYICARSTTPGVGPSTGNKDPGLFNFQLAAWSVFIISVGCQILGQLSLSGNPGGAVFVANVTGFCLFPIYLDVMAHTTPENITSDMFSANKGLGSGV